MKGRLFCFMLVLQLLIFVSIATRSFPPTHAMSHPGLKEAPASAPNQAIESQKGNHVVKESIKSEKMKEVVYDKDIEISSNEIGSSPPSCEHKCYGCNPCEAIQVPSTTSNKKSDFGLLYANYEPESWKCKCGPSFYSP
ncbi:EPIDERMAL PATTERNING FACTOR protein [Trifolium repens]|nr:EPIDERMAL PATTERNING FACTOR protein [Trifolium repens]